MNRYVDQGLIVDLLEGKKILVITPSNDLSKHQFERLEKFVRDHGVRVHRMSKSAGSWSIQGREGGWIYIRTLSPWNVEGAGRGMSPDIVFVHDRDYHIRGSSGGKFAMEMDMIIRTLTMFGAEVIFE